MPIDPRRCWGKLSFVLKNLNLFPSTPPTQDEHQLRNQHISTRLFILLLTLSLTILILYTSLTTITKTVNVTQPTMVQYLQLYSSYSQTLSCDCKQISFSYDTFLHVEHTLHQICNSVFITQLWIEYLALARQQTRLTGGDFQFTSVYTFRSLRALCDLIEQTINNSLTQFYSTQYISTLVLPPDELQLRSDALMSQFISSTITNFLTSLSSVRQMTQNNALMSALQTNNRLEYRAWFGYYVPVFYGNCTCAASAKCSMSFSITDNSNGKEPFTVPGLYIGCYPVEALLQSDLRCLYNQTCLTELMSYFNGSTPPGITPLDASLLIQFKMDSSIEEVLNELMVERWNRSHIYQNYFHACEATGCTDTERTKNSIIYIVTTVIGLIGGLITMLKLIVPRFVALVRRKQQPMALEAGTVHGDRFHEMKERMQHYVRNLNFFPSIPPTQDEHQLRNQHISTRLFILLLTLSLMILILYTSLTTITKTVNVTQPTMVQYLQLYLSYSQTLSCDCKQISFSYDTFLHVEYTLHQICNSVFITQPWIEYSALARQQTRLAGGDFQFTSVYTFRSLRAFCDLIEQTINNSLTQFYSTQYISTLVLPPDGLQLRSDALMSQFISSTITNFLTSLSSIRQMTQNNALLSAAHGDNLILALSSQSPLIISTNEYDNCSCSTSAKCVRAAPIFDSSYATILFRVPGMYIGCYPVEALLQSDLRCFYNQTCLTELMSYFNGSSPPAITPLDASLLIQFKMDSSIEEVLDELMVERWNRSHIYQNYFHACEATGCTYTERTKNSIIYIVTTVIGLIGGLITMLKLIVPRFVALVRRKQQPVALEAGAVHGDRFHGMKERMQHYVRNLNFFPSIPPTQDEHQLRNQHISTRLFILLLTLSLMILILYTSLTTITETVNVTQPTMTRYLQLYSSYSQTLSCDCKQISFSYDTFLHVEYTLHQICNSLFVTPQWLDYLSRVRPGPWFGSDFRFSATYVFQTVQTFCDLIEQTINNSLTQFYSTQYISTLVLPPDGLQLRSDALMSQFISSTITNFLTSLSLIRQTTQHNALLSATQQNFEMYGQSRNITYAVAVTYDNCSCASSIKCAMLYKIDYNLIERDPFIVPGMYIGCYPVEALLQSDLRCFYNQTCIAQLVSYFDDSSLSDITALDASLLIQFKTDSSIEEVLNELMVERWNQSSIYQNYFDACAASRCTYTERTKNSVIYIVTTIIGLIGGLITVLKQVIPRFVQLLTFLIRKFKLTYVQNRRTSPN